MIRYIAKDSLRQFIKMASAAITLIGIECCIAAEIPPPPPPPTITDSVKASTVVVIATGIEFYYESPSGDGKLPAHASLDQPSGENSRPRWLRANVDEVLYCQPPCKNQSEIIIALQLASNELKDAQQKFIKRPLIYVVYDRPFLKPSPSIPQEFSNSWYAARQNVDTSFLPVGRRSEVELAIKETKTSTR